MTLAPHRAEKAARATGVERRELLANLRLVTAMSGMELESRIVALYSAAADRTRAAKCYAAIVRSL